MLYQSACYNTMITGKNRHDTNMVELAIIEGIIKEPNAKLVLIDSELEELSGFYDNEKTLFFTEDINGALIALKKVSDLIDDRIDSILKSGKACINEHIFVCIHNMDAVLFYKRKEHLKQLDKIILFGNKAHVHLIVCIDDATRKKMTGYLFENFFNIVCLEKDNPKEYRYLLNQNCDAPPHGYAYVWTIEENKSELVKIDEVWNTISQWYRKWFGKIDAKRKSIVIPFPEH